MDFWGQTLADMELLHKSQMYPPKSSLLVCTNESAFVTAAVTVEVKGTKDNDAARFTIVKYFNAGINITDLFAILRLSCYQVHTTVIEDAIVLQGFTQCYCHI